MNKYKRTQMNECSLTYYRTFTNTTERTRPLFIFVHLANRTKFFVHVRSFIKRTNVTELPNCSLNIKFVYSPNMSANINGDMHDNERLYNSTNRVIILSNTNENFL
ncbi:hypothetical protein Hanom_Chr07g00631041 [Helianthus anomalus]